MTPTALPALYLSHGSPMFALEPGRTGPALTAYGAGLQGGRAVLLMSPHWMAPAALLGTHPRPPTWHDFGGFPPALYQLGYPAPGDPALAGRAVDLLRAAGIATGTDADRPRDHGAWVPLRHLLPAADVPVVQVALPQAARPADVLAIGRALAPLRAEGVLLVGSGSLTHNLRELFAGGRPAALDAPAVPWATAFLACLRAAIARGDEAALVDYRRQAPEAVRAHPTDEHLLPLFFALGAGGWPAVRPAPPISTELHHGALAMDAFALDEPF